MQGVAFPGGVSDTGMRCGRDVWTPGVYGFRSDGETRPSEWESTGSEDTAPSVQGTLRQ